MSGRSRVALADGRTVTGYRKTLRRNPRRLPVRGATVDPASVPEWVLRFMLPTTIAFSVAEGHTGVIGVVVKRPGPCVETAGKNLDWVLQQASKYLGSITNGTELRIEAHLTRAAYPRAAADAPWHPDEKRSLCLIYVPGPSVVIPRALDPAMVFPAK